jgi:putative endonuclease
MKATCHSEPVFAGEESALDMERRYYMYLMASLSRRLYVGVTNNLVRRTHEHKEARIPGFTARYRFHRLVYFESFQYVRSAIAREKQVKAWRRSRKVSLIEDQNPTWADLSESWKPRSIKQEQIPRPNTGLGMTSERPGAARQ